MSKMFKIIAVFQLQTLLLLIWTVPTLAGVSQAAFFPNSDLWGILGLVWFFGSMYPVFYLYSLVNRITV